MNIVSERIYNVAQRQYYWSFAWIVLSVVVGYSLSRYISLDKSTEAAIAVQSADIIFLLGSIPGILWLFHKQTVKADAAPDETKIKTYHKWLIIRLVVINFNIAVNVVLLGLYADKSYFMCAAMAAVTLLFCRPEKAKILGETNNHGEIKENEE
jgi:hypothetical protein